MTKTTSQPGCSSPSAPAPPARKRPLGRPPKERPRPTSREAQRLAAAILDVLAGGRTPTDAAAALEISPPRYYLLEQRALAGLVAACEPRPVGQTISLKHRMAVLEKELLRSRQECARQQALVRAAQRTIGLTAPAPPKPATKAAGKKGSRKRRPVVRALKAALAIRTAALDEPAATSSGVIATEGKGDKSNPVRHEICAFVRTPRKWYCAVCEARIIFGMAGAKRDDVREEDVTGLKYFDKLAPLLARLHDVGCQRDKAGNRELHFDQYCLLVLLFSVQSGGPLLAGHPASERIAESATQTRLPTRVAGLVQ